MLAPVSKGEPRSELPTARQEAGAFSPMLRCDRRGAALALMPSQQEHPRYAPRTPDGSGGTGSAPPSPAVLLLLMLLPSSPNPPLTRLVVFPAAPAPLSPGWCERALPGRRGGGPIGREEGVLRPLVLDAALPLRPCTLRDRPATGGLCPAALPGRRTCDAPAPEPEEDAEGPRDRPSAEPGRVLVRSEAPPLCVGVGERDGIPIAGDAGLDRDAADDAERDDEPTLLGGLAPDGASDARRFEERDAGRDDSRTASPPAAAAPSRLGGRIPAGAAPTAAPPRPRIVALLAMPPPAVPAPAPVGDPMRGIALPRMTPTLRWSRRLVSALTRVVICCMSRIMVAVSVRGIPRAGLCGRRDEDEEEGVPKPAGPGRVLAGEERFGVEGDEVSPLAPVRARCAVRVERARGGAPCTRGARKGAGLEGGRAEKEVERAILEGEERAEDGGGDMAAAAEGRMRDERRGVGLVSSMEGEGESGGVGEGVRRRGVSSSLGEAAEEEGKGDGDSGSTGVGGTEEGAEYGAGGAAASCVRVNESSSLTSVEGKRASAGRACWEGRVDAPRSSSLSLCTSSSSCALVTSSSSSRAMRSSALLYRDSRSCSDESFSLRARPQEAPVSLSCPGEDGHRPGAGNALATHRSLFSRSSLSSSMSRTRARSDFSVARRVSSSRCMCDMVWVWSLRAPVYLALQSSAAFLASSRSRRIDFSAASTRSSSCSSSAWSSLEDSVKSRMSCSAVASWDWSERHRSRKWARAAASESNELRWGALVSVDRVWCEVRGRRTAPGRRLPWWGAVRVPGDSRVVASRLKERCAGSSGRWVRWEPLGRDAQKPLVNHSACTSCSAVRVEVVKRAGCQGAVKVATRPAWPTSH